MGLSNAESFYRGVGTELAERLGPEWKFFRSHLELRRKTDWGHQSLIVSGGSKFSPYVSLDFRFGSNFKAAKKVEKRLGVSPAYYHIHYYSLNHAHMKGLSWSGPGSWDVNLESPQADLLDELVAAVEGIAFPFFERYQDMELARTGLLSSDWCFGAGDAMWHGLLAIEEALGQRDRFVVWSKTHLSDFSQEQVRLALRQLEAKA